MLPGYRSSNGGEQRSCGYRLPIKLASFLQNEGGLYSGNGVRNRTPSPVPPGDYLWLLILADFQRRTPGPPPFSSMNSTPGPAPKDPPGTCRTYHFFPVALAPLRRAAFAVTVGFEVLAGSRECAAAALARRTPG